MEHTVDCRRPDIYKGADYESCLNCGSIHVQKVSTTDPANHSSSDSELTSEEEGDEVEEWRHQASRDHHEDSASLDPDVGTWHAQATVAENKIAKPFSYRKIDQKEELRLLRIQQTTSPQDPVRCTLMHENLHQLLPPFEAISYTWADESGDSSKASTIFIDSRSFAVTKNCETALRRVRLKNRSRLVWIDAICINQDSEAEKTHQVQLMAQIYARANRVLIFVGESRDRSSEILEILGDPKMSDQDCQKMIASQRLDSSLSAFLSRPYFWRVWVLQEIALAKDAVLICGDKVVPWALIARWSTMVLRDAGLRPAHLMSPKLNLVQALGAFRSRHGQQYLTSLPPALGFQKPAVRDVAQLLNLLDIASFCDASDPRDKVYALLGLVTGLEPLGFLPDYTETVEDVYLGIALLLAQECGPMAILTRAVCRPSVSRRRPWLPDWRHPPGYIPPQEQLAKLNKAVESTKPRRPQASSASGQRGLFQLDKMLSRQGILRINMSMVCTMANMLRDGGLVGITHFKINILPADDGTSNGAIELNVYPKFQYPQWGPYSQTSPGANISEEMLKWLARLRIYSPTPTRNALQAAQIESSRINILESQCLVLLEHPSSSQASPSSVSDIAGDEDAGPSTSSGADGTMGTDNGIFRGLCTVSFTRPWTPMTEQTKGFWYMKSFVLESQGAAGDHVLGWHKKEMISPAFQLKDLEQVLVAKPLSLGISTGT